MYFPDCFAEINLIVSDDKLLKDYSDSDLFIFNSLDRDRDYAVKMINLNSKLKVLPKVPMCL